MYGTLNDEVGYFVVVTSEHPVAPQTMVLGPQASTACRKAIIIPHPAQAV
jgi:hypothetical protein